MPLKLPQNSLFQRADLPDHIRYHVVVDAFGCWAWTAGLNPQGYGQVGYQGRSQQVHRAVYLLMVGEVPAGLELDHLCNTRWCCNPAHLEAVTHRENCRRARKMDHAAKAHRDRDRPLPDNPLTHGTHCTVQQAASYVGCTADTIRRWITDGILESARPFPRGSARISVDISSLRKLVDS